ncbi:M28 family peptidase [Bacteroidales bacterium OttesenSCG-928-B11]|nr:M28 family peptidase [Bacteroidales bacterium OttesenSCG-928-E04]MDL2313319.1 M28 family peptidase [Bacteroidales bacterium OttesenSCG-928-B11]MDL2326628.1 M28 family peptidase [Bacteroidales bacterium OttesenSCG-928-A14]
MTLTKLHPLFFFTLLLPSFFSLQAQDSTTVRQMIATLSSSEMHGRSIAYDGEYKAAEYIRSIFRETKAEPLGNDYFQSYNFPGFAMEGNVSLSINGMELNPFDDYRIYPFSMSLDKQDIPVISADPIILINKEKREKFIKKNSEKFKNSFIYFDISMLDEMKDKYQADQIRLAIYFLSISRKNQYFDVLGYLIGDTKLPVIGLSGTTHERPYAYIQVIAKKMKKAKTLSVSYNNRFVAHKANNVVAKIEGVRQPDSMIVFTAHYDHIGCMGKDVIFHGAHDNASGTATVLSLAQYYSKNPSDYTMVFCLFSGEEGGLRGSNHFADEPLIELEKVKMLLNLDMMCGGSEGIMVVNSREGIPSFYYDKLVKINNEKQYLPAVKSRPNTSNSDHFPFTEKGVNALFIYTMGGPSGGYHEYTDTEENCGLSQWENIFHLIIDWVDVMTSSNK